MMLRQGDRTVDDYQAEFEALSRFAPLLVADERKKVRRFQKGLNLTIRNRLVPLGLTKFSQALASARMIERDMEEQEEEAEYQQKGVRSAMTHEKPEREEPERKRPAFEPKRPNLVICGICGRNHGNQPCRQMSGACYKCGEQGHAIRECPKWKEGGSCYNCGEQGHISRNCPKLTNAPTNAPPNRPVQGVSDRRPMMQGRAYVITREEGSSDVAIEKGKEKMNEE